MVQGTWIYCGIFSPTNVITEYLLQVLHITIEFMCIAVQNANEMQVKKVHRILTEIFKSGQLHLPH